MTSVEDYNSYTDIEHFRKLPDMYIGVSIILKKLGGSLGMWQNLKIPEKV